MDNRERAPLDAIEALIEMQGHTHHCEESYSVDVCECGWSRIVEKVKLWLREARAAIEGDGHEMNLFPHNKSTGRWCLACTKSGAAQAASARKLDIDRARDWLEHTCSTRPDGCGYKYNYECLAEQLLAKIRLEERERVLEAAPNETEGARPVTVCQVCAKPIYASEAVAHSYHFEMALAPKEKGTV